MRAIQARPAPLGVLAGGPAEAWEATHMGRGSHMADPAWTAQGESSNTQPDTSQPSLFL